jgi:plastocyanin
MPSSSRLRYNNPVSRKRWTSFIFAAAVSAAAANAAAAKVVHIDIEKLVFTPKDVTVEVGDTLEWTNKDAFAHTATADDKSWEVVLAPHATGTYVVESAGIVGYFCRFHPNMRGKITAAAP